MQTIKAKFRHAARVARLMQRSAATPIWNEMKEMLEKIKQEEKEVLSALQTAHDYFDAGYRSQLDNSPELYHVKTRGFEEIYKLHMPSGSCDAEMDAADRALIQAIGRNDSPDKPLPLN